MEPLHENQNPALPPPSALQSLKSPPLGLGGFRFAAYGQERCFVTGRQVMAERGTCIVGMSPGNTFFTEDTIKSLLQSCATHFSRVVVFIPAVPARHTFAALGYSDSEATAKARLKGNNLRHRCERAASLTLACGVSLEFVEWETNVAAAEEYSSARLQLGNLYESSPEFKKLVKEATEKVLMGRRPQCRDEITEARIERGAEYLLEELAFLEIAPQLLGIERAAYVYHRKWPVFEKLIEGAFDSRERTHLGFVLAVGPRE